MNCTHASPFVRAQIGEDLLEDNLTLSAQNFKCIYRYLVYKYT